MRNYLIIGFFSFHTITAVIGAGENEACGKKPLPEYTLEIVSGNSQYTREGTPFKKPLTVLLTDTNKIPAGNIAVRFTHLNTKTDKWELLTDSSGKAVLNANVCMQAGSYQILVTCEKAICNPVVFELNVRRSNWVLLLLVGLSGGLAMFLFGMGKMSEGIQNCAGNRMRNILSRLTHNRFIAMGLGALVTMVIQSSSATNVMLISFVNSRLLKFRQTIGVILGAAIGTTITAQIIAFRITDYALFFVASGLIVQYFSKKQQIKELGRALFGFGILFFGMHIMSDSMFPLRTYDPFLQVILQMQIPAIGILVGAVFTALIQSSSAFIGILIILAMQGLLSIHAAIPLLIGANVGTAITTVLASLNGSREAKQVALAHTIIKVSGAVIFVFFLPQFTKLVLDITHPSATESAVYNNLTASPRQIANAHTIYNILLCSLFIPFTNSLSRLINRMYPFKEVPDKIYNIRYLDDTLLKTPVMAMNGARLELVRMIKKVYYMTEKIINPFLDKNPGILKEIELAEKEINFLRDQINSYLIRLTQNTIASKIAEEAFMTMNAVREFEQIADINSHYLKEKAMSWCNSPYQFSAEGKAELIRYHTNTLNIIIQSLKVFEDFDLKAARKLKLQYDRYREEYFELERQHYERLRNNIENTISSSKTHLEIITLLRVISSHAINTARIIISTKNNQQKSPSYDPGKSSN